uniref:ligand-binding sensor domain-containing protein n=1 Tax=Flavobacterium sp. TaxID=239 RepID=UPI002FDEA2E6
MLRKTLFSVLFLCITVALKAQSEEFVFKNYDTRNGLCNNNVTAITEDQKGFIWIGTKEGLSRFDGAEFQNIFDSGNYSCLHAIGNNLILLVKNNRLNVLNSAANQLLPLKDFANIEIVDITKLSEDLYAFNAVNRFILTDGKLKKTAEIKIEGKIYNNIFVRRLSESQLLVGNCFDYYEYDLTTQKLRPFPLNMRKYKDENFDLFELKYIDEKERKIYINDYFTGLYIFDFQGRLLEHYNKGLPNKHISSTNIIAYLKDKDGSIWIGTHAGINLFKKGQNRIIRHQKENDLSLKANIITSLFLDRNSNVWIGTNQGISVYKNKLNSKVNKISFTGNHDYFFNTIAFGNHTVYVGDYLNQVLSVNPENKKANPVNCRTKVWGLYNFDDKIIITGHNALKEVETYFPNTNTIEQTHFLKTIYAKTDLVTLAYQHSNGDVWYSGNAGGGFVRRKANSNKVITYYKDKNGKPLFKSSYYALAVEDSDKNLWFGVNRSELLLQWNYKTNRFKEIDFNHQKGTNMPIFGGVTGLEIAEDNIIWASFEGGGIIKFNPKTNAVKQYSLANGLNTNIINDIELDHRGRVWMLSNEGIGCLDPKTERFFLMDIWDGFFDNPVNYNVLKRNPKTQTMWIGAINNLYYFNPDEILKSKKNKTNLYLDYLIVNDRKITDFYSKPLHFQPDENNMEFKMVAVDIENGKNLEYSYKLDGLNKKWYNLNATRTVLFQRLEAGTYTFNARVRSKGSKDWIYLANPLPFTIANYWYKTWWFFTLLTVGLLFLMFRIVSSYFDRKLEKQQNEIEKQKLIEEERKRIAKDMHDDLGSGLTKITYLSQMALQKEDNKSLLSGIKNTSTELVES